MGKETVYFKETREKAITKQDRQNDRKEKFEKIKESMVAKSKNISKKDADKVSRLKAHNRSEKFAAR
jgi:hypothetical protein